MKIFPIMKWWPHREIRLSILSLATWHRFLKTAIIHVTPLSKNTLYGFQALMYVWITWILLKIRVCFRESGVWPKLFIRNSLLGQRLLVCQSHFSCSETVKSVFKIRVLITLYFVLLYRTCQFLLDLGFDQDPCSPSACKFSDDSIWISWLFNNYGWSCITVPSVSCILYNSCSAFY